MKNEMIEYKSFINKKKHTENRFGFKPVNIPDFLFDFQKYLLEWSLAKGRGANFIDCGMGKTPLNLSWCDNVVRHTNKNVLILCPLSVTYEFLKQGEKFGIDVKRSNDGKPAGKITVTNYEKLHLFDSNDYVAVACDESSIIKNYLGKTKYAVSRFLAKMDYRLLLTATAAPNDFPELGTSSEVLGNLDYNEMLKEFFRNTQNDKNPQWSEPKFVLKNHAKEKFWKWITSWARAARRPSDLGFSDDRFVLPELIENHVEVKNSLLLDGCLFPLPAKTNNEQLEEKYKIIPERCEVVKNLVEGKDFSAIWCQLDDEADYLEKIIPGAVQISGKMKPERKEEIFDAFSNKQIKRLVIKPKIGAFGLNWQHCNHTVFFPSHSYEKYYQAVRRFYRFGQERPVTVDIPYSSSEIIVFKNLQRKARQAEEMFTQLVKHMNDSLGIKKIKKEENIKLELPKWIN